MQTPRFSSPSKAQTTRINSSDDTYRSPFTLTATHQQQCVFKQSRYLYFFQVRLSSSRNFSWRGMYIHTTQDISMNLQDTHSLYAWSFWGSIHMWNINPFRTPVPFWGQTLHTIWVFCPHTYMGVRCSKGLNLRVHTVAWALTYQAVVIPYNLSWRGHF